MERLKSRKLWLTVAGCAYFMLQGDAQSALTLAMTYLGAQGVADGLAAFKKPTAALKA